MILQQKKQGSLVQKMQVVIIDWMIPENFLVPIRSSFFSLSSRRPLVAAASLLRGAAPAPGCDTGNLTVVEPDFRDKKSGLTRRNPGLSSKNHG